MITNIRAVDDTNGEWRVAFDMQRSRLSQAPTYWLILTNGKKEFRSLLNQEHLADETSEAYASELRRATEELMAQAGLDQQ